MEQHHTVALVDVIEGIHSVKVCFYGLYDVLFKWSFFVYLNKGEVELEYRTTNLLKFNPTI